MYFGARGHFHGCRNKGTEPLRLLVTVTPGTSIDALFTKWDDIARKQGCPVDPAQIVEVSMRHGVSFPDPGPRRPGPRNGFKHWSGF